MMGCDGENGGRLYESGTSAQACVDFSRIQTIVSYKRLICNRRPQGFSMAADHTRTAILSAAERLYAERGFADVTMRDIVTAADVNLSAVNYHFGSKDELFAELFVTRSLVTNRARLKELNAAEAIGGGRADISAIFKALVGPTLRGCLGPGKQRSNAARFMIRASLESIPPIRKIKNREVDHLKRFAAAIRRTLPDHDAADIFWSIHFALAMAHQTIRDTERLDKLSDGACDIDDVAAIIARIVDVAGLALSSRSRFAQAAMSRSS